MSPFSVRTLNPTRYNRTVVWAFLLSTVIVVTMSGLARAVRNFRAALVDKPDVAIYLLLPEKGITTSTVVKEAPDRREYLAESNEGPLLIRLVKSDGEWQVEGTEKLH